MADTVQTVATVVSVVPGVGTVGASILTTAASVVKAIGGLFRGSPPVVWEEANEISVPVATQIVTNLDNTIGAEKIGAVFNSYVPKIKTYILNSPHHPERREEIVGLIDSQAVQMSNGFRPDGFNVGSIKEQQLAWAIYLHAIWLFEGSSHDEVGNGGAMKKFQASLEPTLIAAVAESTGEKVNTSGATGTQTTTTAPATSSLASISSNKFVMIALVGAALGLLYFSAKGK